VVEHVRCHLGRDAWQRLRQEAGRVHAGFDGAERMLHPLPTPTPSSPVIIEPVLNRFENVLVFPSRDAALFPGGALMFDGAVRASVGPVASQHQPVFFVSIAVGEPFCGGTDLDVLFSDVAEVPLAKTRFCFCIEFIGFGNVTVISALMK
jgi:hypothetical protein